MKERIIYYQFRGGKRVQIPIPKVVKLYNSGMGGVDFMHQWTASYRLDQKSSVRFYLRLFFDLMDIACVNSYLIYYMKDPNKLPLLDYKTFAAKNLVQYHQGRKGAVPMSRPCQSRNQLEPIENHGWHLPNYQTMLKRCAYCGMEGKENRTFVICLSCNIPLCLVKERNCFQKHHM